MDSAKVCPNCGAHISEAGDEKPLQSGLKATVRDFTSQDCRPRNAVLKATVRDAGQICEEMGPKFTLAPVDGFAPEVKPIIVGDSGSAVNDALFSIGDDGGLYLEDNSKLRNVYIQTTRRINLQVGDIVVIDNMRYIIK